LWKAIVSRKGKGSVKMGKRERGKEEGAMVVQGNESECLRSEERKEVSRGCHG